MLTISFQIKNLIQHSRYDGELLGSVISFKFNPKTYLSAQKPLSVLNILSETKIYNFPRLGIQLKKNTNIFVIYTSFYFIHFKLSGVPMKVHDKFPPVMLNVTR